MCEIYVELFLVLSYLTAIVSTEILINLCFFDDKTHRKNIDNRSHYYNKQTNIIFFKIFMKIPILNANIDLK